MFQLLLIFPKGAMHGKIKSFILSMLLNLLTTEILTKYNVSLFLGIKVSQKAIQRKNDSYRRLSKKQLGHWIVKSVLKVPGPRLCRLISHLFYPLGAYLLPFDPTFSNTCWDEKEFWGFEMQNTEMWHFNRRFWSHSLVGAHIFL